MLCLSLRTTHQWVRQNDAQQRAVADLLDGMRRDPAKVVPQPRYPLLGPSPASAADPTLLCASQHRDLFRQLDKDGNGSLEPGELTDAFARHGLTVPAREVEGLFATMDKNADGRVSVAEFLQTMQDWQSERAGLVPAQPKPTPPSAPSGAGLTTMDSYGQRWTSAECSGRSSPPHHLGETTLVRFAHRDIDVDAERRRRPRKSQRLPDLTPRQRQDNRPTTLTRWDNGACRPKNAFLWSRYSNEDTLFCR